MYSTQPSAPVRPDIRYSPNLLGHVLAVLIRVEEDGGGSVHHRSRMSGRSRVHPLFPPLQMTNTL